MLAVAEGVVAAVVEEVTEELGQGHGVEACLLQDAPAGPLDTLQ